MIIIYYQHKVDKTCESRGEIDIISFKQLLFYSLRRTQYQESKRLELTIHLVPTFGGLVIIFPLPFCAWTSAEALKAICLLVFDLF